MTEKHILEQIQAMYLRLVNRRKSGGIIFNFDAQVYVDYCNLLYEQDHHDSLLKEQHDMYIDMCHTVEDSPQF